MPVSTPKEIEYGKRYYRKHKRDRVGYNARYYQEHKEWYKNYAHQKWQGLSEEARERENLRSKEWAKAHRGIMRMSRRKSSLKLKTDVFRLVCRGEIKCCICGESRMDCLSIDHINGGGTQHRKALKQELNVGGGSGFYKWLRDHFQPATYQILCMNCQFIKKQELKECHPL